MNYPSIAWTSQPHLQHAELHVPLKAITTPLFDMDAWLLQPKSLLFIGPPGRGKTHTACTILQAFSQERPAPYSADFISAIDIEEYLDRMLIESKRVSHELVDRLCTPQYKMVVLDDLGAERDTDMLHRAIFRFVEKRLNRLYIITTNLTFEDIQARYGTRIADRLRVAVPVTFSGESMRHQQ